MSRFPFVSQYFGKGGRHRLKHRSELTAGKAVGIMLKLGSLHKELRRVRAIREAHDAIDACGEHRSPNAAASVHREKIFVFRVGAKQVRVDKVRRVSVEFGNTLQRFVDEGEILHESFLARMDEGRNLRHRLAP